LSKRDIYEVAIKLLAIYFAITAIEAIPPLGMALATYNSEHVVNPYLYIGSPASLTVIYLFFAVLFFKKSNFIVGMLCGPTAIKSNSEIEKLERGNLSLWIKVIGLYYFVMSSGSLVSHISQLGNRGYYWWTPVITKALILCLSLWFIFRTSSVKNIMEKYSK